MEGDRYIFLFLSISLLIANGSPWTHTISLAGTNSRRQNGHISLLWKGPQLVQVAFTRCYPLPILTHTGPHLLCPLPAPLFLFYQFTNESTPSCPQHHLQDLHRIFGSSPERASPCTSQSPFAMAKRYTQRLVLVEGILHRIWLLKSLTDSAVLSMSIQM